MIPDLHDCPSCADTDPTITAVRDRAYGAAGMVDPYAPAAVRLAQAEAALALLDDLATGPLPADAVQDVYAAEEYAAQEAAVARRELEGDAR